MKKLPLYLLLALGISVGARAAESLDDAMKRATVDYVERLRKASEELNRVRERIATEKAPLQKEMRAIEDRIIGAESDVRLLQTGHENLASDQKKLIKEFDALRKQATYVVTLSHDSLKSLTDGLAPGEEQFRRDQLQALQAKLDDTVAGPPVGTAIDVAELFLERTTQALGGYTRAGSSLMSETNQVLKGTFAFAGPETFFLPEQGGTAGTVRSRQDAALPITYPLPNWKPDSAAAFFKGELGTMVADSSSGKALRLRETSGTWWEHVKKGGVVASLILVVGVLALVLIIQKLRDLSRMAVDTPVKVRSFLETVSSGSAGAAEAALAELKPTTRELFAVGLRHVDEPREILEERLEVVLLEQRLHFERRLPLLAVIATAAPLMGLLGTVVGMVKTFALITVFGTGNAGKLSSGISEVLVATELGLAVAIPALVAHGFLANRIHRNLSLLERYALQFVTAADLARHNSLVPGGNVALAK